MAEVAGQDVPVASLAALLGEDESAAQPAGDTMPIVVLRFGETRLAVRVDAFHGHGNSLIQALEGPAAAVGHFAGGVLRDNGTVALVLNPSAVIEASQRMQTGALPFAAGEREAEQRPATVLVVDDSFTTRTLEKSILEAHGYRVLIAVDGLEALDRLRAEEVDLVIADIQMPRMDGLDLLVEIKNDPQLAHIPVILVTSLDKREDRERGLELGADAYIVKRKFDHQDLLATIQQVI